MDDLRTLLVKNQTNRDRLMARARYLSIMITNFDFDTHKQLGPYSEFWDDWYEHAKMLLTEVKEDIRATEQFCAELREFININNSNKRKSYSKTKVRDIKEMTKLAKEAILCQSDLLKMTDLRISEHKEFTNKLLLVEAIDNLNEE